MRAFRVTGTSMWPALKTGDVVITDESGKLEAGRLILRTIEGVEIVHRLLSREMSKGDRFLEPDPQIESSDRIEVIVRVIPRRLADRNGNSGWSDLGWRRLSKIQAALSLFQVGLGFRAAKYLVLLILITNGWVLRSLLYATSLGEIYVVRKR